MTTRKHHALRRRFAVTAVATTLVGSLAAHTYATEADGNKDVIINDNPNALKTLVESKEYKNAYGISDQDLDDFALYFSGTGNESSTGIIRKTASGNIPEATPGGRLYTQPQLTQAECGSPSMSSNPHRNQKTVSNIPGISQADLSGRGDVRNSANTLIFEDKINDNLITVITPATPTREVQKALDCASNETNGGIVYFEPGDYLIRELFLRSNLRVVIDKDATFYIPSGSRNLFTIGRNIIRTQDWLATDPVTGRLIENIEIAVAGGEDDRFTVDIKGADQNGNCGKMVNNPDNGGVPTTVIDRDFNRNASPFLVGFAKNFAISGVNIIDNYTISPSIFLVTDTDGQIGNRSWQGAFYPNPYQNRAPNFGAIQHINATGVSTNYATLQLFAGTNIYVNNLSATDGITVRLEPGRSEDPLNQAGSSFGALKNVELDNLFVENGFTAVFIQPHAKIFEDILIKDIEAIDSSTAVFTELSELPTHYLEPNDENDGGTRTYAALANIQDEEGLRNFNLPIPGEAHIPIWHRNAELFYKRGRVADQGVVLDGRIRFVESSQNQDAEGNYFDQVAPSIASRDEYKGYNDNGIDVCTFDANVEINEFNYADITPASRVFLQKTWLDQIRQKQVSSGNAADEEMPYDFGRRRRAIPEPIAPVLAASTFSENHINDNVEDIAGNPLDHTNIATGRYQITFGGNYNVAVPSSSQNRITTYSDANESSRLSGQDDTVLYRNQTRDFGGNRAGNPSVNRIYDHLTGDTFNEVRTLVINDSASLDGTIRLGSSPSTGGGNGSSAPDVNGDNTNNRPLEGTDNGETVNGLGGNDLIVGKGGKDTLIGGAGRDTFRFETPEQTGNTPGSADEITDFNVANERIDLRPIDANTETGGNADFTLVSTRTRAAGTVFVRTQSGNTVIEGYVDNDNTDNRPDFVIVVTGVTGLTASNFML